MGDGQLTKEIPRQPDIPSLTPEEINRIGKIVFIEPNVHKADLIWIFGYRQGPWDKIADIWKMGYGKKILVNGLLDSHTGKKEKPLAHVIVESLRKHGIDLKNILIQDKSFNTMEDVVFGKKLLEDQSVFPKSILFVAKAHHSGRCLLTLRKYFPGVTFYPFIFDASYDGVIVKKDDWWKNPVSAARVYGEYLRIIKYSERGDIEKPEVIFS